MAWPPKRSIRPGWRASTSARASRMCRPGMERAEPRRISAPGSAGAKAITGRCRRSFIFDATRPTTRMPVSIEQAGRHRSLTGHVQHHAGQRLLGVVSHRLLHGAPFRIDLLQRLRDLARLARVFGQQQRDAQRHVFQPACGIQARAEREADVGGRQPRGITAAGFDQRTQANTALSRADAAGPALTSARLFGSSATRSATVPTATRSSSVVKSGPLPSARHLPRACAGAAPSARRRSRRRLPAICSGTHHRPDSDRR